LATSGSGALERAASGHVGLVPLLTNACGIALKSALNRTEKLIVLLQCQVTVRRRTPCQQAGSQYRKQPFRAGTRGV
jgi:hypothetical protein